jgi:hypothetical protein
MAVVANGVSVIIHLIYYTVGIRIVQHEIAHLVSDKPALLGKLIELQTIGSSASSRDGSIQRKNLHVNRRLSILFFND